MTPHLPHLDFVSLAALLLGWIGQAVFQGTLLALLTAAVLVLFRRRVHPTVHGALWLVVLIKFVLPIGPGWSHSLASVTRLLSDRFTTAPALAASADVSGAAQSRLVWTPASGAAESAIRPAAAPSRNWRGLAVGTAAAFYVAAALLMATRKLRAFLRFAAACRRLPEADGVTAELVAAICARMGLRCVPSVRISDDAPAPFVLGFFRPILVLSRQQLVRPDELEAVVLHEIAHLRRGDFVVRYLQWLAGTWLFFWPVVAWVNRRIDLAREAACDEWALRHGRLSAGEYARCLLRALHPASSRRMSYVPAAMAANLGTVERRIEMILDSKRTRWTKGSLSLPALALLAAWSGFVLTGASAADEPKCAAGETKTVTCDGNKVVVVKVGDGDESNADIHEQIMKALKGADPQLLAQIHAQLAKGGKATAGSSMKVHRVNFGPGDGHAGMFMFRGGTSEKQLAEFLNAHPTADANGDGNLSASERDAYLVALAMSDSASVLAQFPKADRNSDGRLDADEAARWVTSSNGEDCVKVIKRTCGDDANAAPADAAANAKVQVHVVRKAQIRTGTQEPADFGAIAMKRPFESAAAKWLLANITAQPAAAEVARYLGLVEEAPRAAFLEANPDADANHDGKLTDAEQTAYLHNQAMKWLLEAKPELDLNGDGVLSPDELHKSGQAGGNIKIMKIQHAVTGPDGQTKSGEKTVVLQGDQAADQDFLIDVDEDVQTDNDFTP